MSDENNQENMKIKQASMAKDIDHIKKSINKIEEYIKDDRKWKEDFTEKANCKYAAKNEVSKLWKAVYAILAAVGGIVLFIGNMLK